MSQVVKVTDPDGEVSFRVQVRGRVKTYTSWSNVKSLKRLGYKFEEAAVMTTSEFGEAIRKACATAYNAGYTDGREDALAGSSI